MTGFAGAIEDAWERTPCPILLIGMDTPQVSVADLEAAAMTLLAPGVDAVLGLADDGGYWVIGSRHPVPGMFTGVPMSTDRTAASQLHRLDDLGLRCSPVRGTARRGHHLRRPRGGRARSPLLLRRSPASLRLHRRGAESCLRPSSDRRS